MESVFRMGKSMIVFFDRSERPVIREWGYIYNGTIRSSEQVLKGLGIPDAHGLSGTRHGIGAGTHALSQLTASLSVLFSARPPCCG